MGLDMATIISDVQFDIRTIDFFNPYVLNIRMEERPSVVDMSWDTLSASFSSMGIYGVMGMTPLSMNGAYVYGWSDAAYPMSLNSYLEMFGGAGLQTNENNVLTAGIVTSYFRLDGTFRSDLAIMGIHWDAEDLAAAIATSSTADEIALIQQALRGNDTFDLGWHDDYCRGYRGHDTITGGAGDDTLFGDSGRDRLFGGWDDDTLNGGSGKDRLDGESGNDTLVGMTGRDILTGGTGEDVFVFSSTRHSSARPARADLITDFESGTDRIDLSGIGDLTFIGDERIGTDDASEVSFHILNRRGTSRDLTLVRIDTDDDARPESVIRLTGIHHLTSDDFIL